MLLLSLKEKIMNKAGHMLGGIVTLGLVLKYNDFNLINEIKIIKGGLLSIGVLTGAFLPDLDAESSYIRSKLLFIPDIYGIIQDFAKNNFFSTFFKHRGVLLHSMWTIIGLLIIRAIICSLSTNATIPTVLTGLIFGVKC
jgi:membrane-bound metal-dependent hydrolase YbcI (DUF457 family)